MITKTLKLKQQCVHHIYIIGLTAPPYRMDGLNSLLDMYFGKYKIARTLWREHIAYKVSTGFKPTVEQTANGRVN